MHRIARPLIGTITLLASAALVAVGSGPATAASSHASAASAAHQSAPYGHADATGVRVFKRPVASYTANACFTDLSTVSNGTSVSLLVNLCGFQIEVTPTTLKEEVPTTWQRWGQRPHVEKARPDVLWTNGSGSLALSWGSQNTIGGVEVQPRHSGSDVFTATYFSGPSGTGAVVGTVVRRASAPGGARLLAARFGITWQSMVITSRSGGDFAVAQIRGS